MTRGVRDALAMAQLSTLRFRVGAIVMNSNSQYGHCNARKTHPRLRAHGYPEWADLHAELGAIIKAGGECEGATMYVARLKRGGEVGLARPCPYCMTAIVESGIKRVVWTTDDGVEEVRL